MECMANMENLPLPNEILLKIFGYLSIKDLNQCAQVSKRVRETSLELKKKKENIYSYLRTCYDSQMKYEKEFGPPPSPASTEYDGYESDDSTLSFRINVQHDY